MGRRLRSRAPDSGHYDVASDGGAEHWATIASLIETRKQNDVDPLGYQRMILVSLLVLTIDFGALITPVPVATVRL
jgi:hypothetical protein